MIGLTGGIASGKSTVTKRLRELGAFVIDADEVSREIMADGALLRSLRAAFGDEVFRGDGSLDRAALAECVFSDPSKTKLLNSLTHPAIAAELERRAAAAEEEYPLVFVDAALLLESGFARLCRSVWIVTADEETRILRTIARDGCTREEALARISRQATDGEKIELAGKKAVVIENNGTSGELAARVDRLFGLELKKRRTERTEL